MIGITYYALYDPKAKMYHLPWSSNKVRNWGHDPDWNPTWSTGCYNSHGLTKAEAENRWSIYEFQRLEYRPELPKLVIIPIRPRNTAYRTPDGSTVEIVRDDMGVSYELSPMFRMIRRMRSKHGTVMADALVKLQTDKQPIWAIKRKGQTRTLVKDTLPDTILHSGQYMFFYNRDDIILAKIALGPNIAMEYDLGIFACMDGKNYLNPI